MISLSKREMKLVKLLIAIILVLAIYFLIISPIIDYKFNLEKEYESNISKLNNLNNLYENYVELKQKKTQYQNLLKDNEGIATLIENYAKETNILQNKSYTRDHPSIIQNKYKKVTTNVKFEGVDINSILKFIHKMENSNKIIKVAYLRIQQALKGRETYDVTIKFDSFSMK